MVTKTFSAGTQSGEYTDTDGTFDVFNATAATFRALKRTSQDYPCRIRNAASGFTFNGGTFLGNILEADGRLDVYKKTSNWNSALLFVSDGRTGTIDGAVFGIQDNLDVCNIDAIRLNGSNDITVRNVRCWGVRDDFIEFDNSPGDLTVEDCFAENIYTGFSAKDATASRIFTIRRTMVHHKSWIEDQSTPSRLTHGHPFKDAPTIRLDDFHLAVAPAWEETGYNRTFNALSRTTVQSGGATLYVLGGSHENRSLINTFQSRGYTVIEDGGGSSATNAWNAQKAAFLGTEPPEPPPVTPTFGASVTFNVTVA
jgi:hypothetical protein